MKTRMSCGAAALAAAAGAAWAQPVVDGMLDLGGIYGPIRFVQNQPTGFGDNNLGDRDRANGSEIDNAYGVVSGGRLYLFFGGNLETNWNKLDLFFDVRDSGQYTLRGDNVDIDFGGLNRMGDDGTGNGLTLDEGFKADYWVGITNGLNGNNEVEMWANAAVLRPNGKLRDLNGNALDYGAYDGGLKSLVNPTPFAGPRIDPQDGFTPNIYCNFGPRKAGDSVQANPLNPVGTPLDINVSIDNSNTEGVTGSTTTGAELVTTGIEISIELLELGQEGVNEIRVAGFINGGGHDFISNQVIGGLPGPDNIGEPRVANFTNIAGDQFITVPVDEACYADCDQSTGPGVLDIFDFLCFQNAYDRNDPYACNCDLTTGPNTCDIFDFLCFQNAFDAGCP